MIKMKDFYKENMTHIHCSEAQKKKWADTLSLSQKKSRRKSSFLAAAAVIMLLLICIKPELLTSAMTHIMDTVVSYRQVVFHDLPFTRVYMPFSRWNTEQEGTEFSDENLYEGVYEDILAAMSESEAKALFLPHYETESYQAAEADGYVWLANGKPPLSFAYWMTGEDSSFYIRFTEESSESSYAVFTGRLDSHYQLQVNGITYEIMHCSSDYLYEDYLKVHTKELGELAPPMSREDFERYLTHPIHIHVMINGWNYEYMLSEGMDVGAFLETIY